MAKYKTYKALKKAFDNGELKDYQLWVDNDSCGLEWIGKVPRGENKDEYRDMKNDECRDWFYGDGYRDLVEALNAGGMPAEWV